MERRAKEEGRGRGGGAESGARGQVEINRGVSLTVGGPIFGVKFPIPFGLFRFGAMVWDFTNKHALHKNGVDNVKSDKFGA